MGFQGVGTCGERSERTSLGRSLTCLFSVRILSVSTSASVLWQFVPLWQSTIYVAAAKVWWITDLVTTGMLRSTPPPGSHAQLIWGILEMFNVSNCF